MTEPEDFMIFVQIDFPPDLRVLVDVENTQYVPSLGVHLVAQAFTEQLNEVPVEATKEVAAKPLTPAATILEEVGHSCDQEPQNELGPPATSPFSCCSRLGLSVERATDFVEVCMTADGHGYGARRRGRDLRDVESSLNGLRQRLQQLDVLGVSSPLTKSSLDEVGMV